MPFLPTPPEPARQTESVPLRRRHFMRNVVASEGAEGPRLRKNFDQLSAGVKSKLPAVFFLPIRIEIERVGDRALVRVGETVHVLPVKGPRRINGVMRLDRNQPQKKTSVQFLS